MRISTAGNSNRTSGFTLIELAVVILLIGLFSLISVPLLSHTGQRGLDASARRLAGTVKYLFNETALTGPEHRLVFNLDQGRYYAMVREEDGALESVTGPGKGTSLRKGVRFNQINLPGRGSFTSGEVTVRIHPSGWLEETVAQLTDEDQTLTLRMNPLTGASEIFEGAREFAQD